MQPMVGQLIHRDELSQWDLDGFRLNWRPDNTAKVTRIEQDLTGFVRCSAAGGCEVADYCAFGKPHKPDGEDMKAGACFDHRPHVPDGVLVWAVPCVANAQNEAREDRAGKDA